MDRESVEEIKRHFGVVAEELRGEIRLVAESAVAFREETRHCFSAMRSDFRKTFKELSRLVRPGV